MMDNMTNSRHAGDNCRSADGPSAHAANAGEPPALRHDTPRQAPVWHSRGYLPHVENMAIQFITYRLFDSVPDSVVDGWRRELAIVDGTDTNAPECQELRRRVERYADAGHGSCFLRDSRIASIVQDNLLHFDGERYRLLAWCIMPNHVHVLIEVFGGWTVSRIVQGWRSFTAHALNSVLGRTGRFWQPEYFDRYIRNERHFHDTVAYIDANPGKAGLVDWPWRSASCRSADGPSAPAHNAGEPPALRHNAKEGNK